MAEASTNIVREPQAGDKSPAQQRSGPRLPRWELLTLGVWFVTFSALAEYFPRTGDDWAWGSIEGSNRINNFFQGLNGRYSGDLAILGLLRTGWFAALVVSAAIVASLYLVLHIAAARTPLGYAMVSALFLAMPHGVWREAVVWLAGFVNYAMGALVFLAFFAMAQSEWQGRLRRATTVRLAGVALVSFVGQFFIEHVSVCICAVGALLTIAFRRTKGSIPRYTMTWTIAAIVGAAVMFSNRAYRRAASGAGYQKAQSLSGPHALHRLEVKTLDYLPTQAIVWNIILNGVLAVLLVALVAVSGRMSTRVGKAIVVLTIGYLAIAWVLSFVERDARSIGESKRAFAMIAGLLMLAALLLAARSLVQSPQRRWTVVVACLSLVCMVGPLILVNPVGPRLFYPTYLVLLVLVSVVGAEVREQVPALRSSLAWAPVQLISIGLVAYLFVVYVTIHNAIDDRLAHVRAEVRAGETTVLISPLPYPYFVHNGDPFFSVLYSRFKEYYGVPKDVKLQLDPNPWLKSPGKHSLPAP